MKCVTCSNTDSSLLKLQTYVDNNTLKEISVVLPDLEIPTSQGPVYVCVTCQEQVTTFYRIKRTNLNNLYHLNHYKEILKPATSDRKFNDLKIIINNNKITATQKQAIEFVLNQNCQSLSADKNQFIEKDSNLSDVEASKQQSLPKDRRFKCSDCDKAFTRRYHLDRHSRVHTRERPFMCLTCRKTFTQCSSLNQHKLIHTNEKRHECDVCHTTFTLKTTLVDHMQSHGYMRPYQCAVCCNKFTRSSHLHDHMRTHTGEKPHVCHLCLYKCSHAGDLKTHMRTHTGEKPYNCELCQKSFTRSNRLKEHKLRMHENKDID